MSKRPAACCSELKRLGTPLCVAGWAHQGKLASVFNLSLCAKVRRERNRALGVRARALTRDPVAATGEADRRQHVRLPRHDGWRRLRLV